MWPFLQPEVPSLSSDRELHRKQMDQIVNLMLQSPFDGRLHQFRETLDKRGRRPPTNLRYPLPVYSDLRDIEQLEAQLNEGDSVEFIVQCCSICEVNPVEHDSSEGYPYWRLGGNTWIFDRVRNIGEIALLRHRLESLDPSHALLEALDANTTAAVRRCVDERLPQWQELFMLLRSAETHTLMEFAELFEESTWFKPVVKTMPRAALSLLLSYISDFFAPGRVSCLTPAYRPMILHLVACGGSLMTSRKDRPRLQSILMKHLGLEKRPWWLEETTPADEDAATALRRLAVLDWEPAEMKELLLSTCCTLDLRSDFATSQVTNCPTLKCLAAQKLRAEQVRELPLTTQYRTSKHIVVEADDE